MTTCLELCNSPLLHMVRRGHRPRCLCPGGAPATLLAPACLYSRCCCPPPQGSGSRSGALPKLFPLPLPAKLWRACVGGIAGRAGHWEGFDRQRPASGPRERVRGCGRTGPGLAPPVGRPAPEVDDIGLPPCPTPLVQAVGRAGFRGRCRLAGSGPCPRPRTLPCGYRVARVRPVAYHLQAQGPAPAARPPARAPALGGGPRCQHKWRCHPRWQEMRRRAGDPPARPQRPRRSRGRLRGQVDLNVSRVLAPLHCTRGFLGSTWVGIASAVAW